jgi:hypothetical protein
VMAHFVHAITILSRLFKLDHSGVRMCPYLLYGHAMYTGNLYWTAVELSLLFVQKRRMTTMMMRYPTGDISSSKYN